MSLKIENSRRDDESRPVCVGLKPYRNLPWERGVNYFEGCQKLKMEVGRLLRPDIVHFHLAYFGTEIFLRELTLSTTLSSNPKSSRPIDP
jgi:hypothetical protein